jgi:hypothetical protein
VSDIEFAMVEDGKPAGGAKLLAGGARFGDAAFCGGKFCGRVWVDLSELGNGSAAGNKAGAVLGGGRDDGFTRGTCGALAAASPPIGKTGMRPELVFGDVVGALVLGNSAADGSGGILAVCSPDVGLFGGSACDAMEGSVSVNHEGGPAGGAVGLSVDEFTGSSVDA